MIHVREFNNPTELHEHYRALKAKFFPSRPMTVAQDEPTAAQATEERVSRATHDFVDWFLANPGAAPSEEQHDLFLTGGDARRLKLAVLTRLGFTEADSDGLHKKSSPAVNARNAAIVAVYVACPWMPTPEIGRLFNRDHATVIQTAKKAGVRK